LRDGGLGELRVPLTWAAGLCVVVAIVAAIAILVMDRRQTFQGEAYGAAQRLGDRVAAPVGGVLAAPIGWVGDGVNGVKGYFFAASENRRLKAELRDMRQWRDTAIALRDTNERFRTLLKLRTEPPVPMVAARVITDARGPFANTRLANAGQENGVMPGNPVMSENGLVGRVIGVTAGVSRVLLLTDIASHTPVMIDRTNARAILTGDGGPNPKLDYLRGEQPVKAGDRVLTSGDGGVLPRGLPVGTAVKGLDGRWRVVLDSDAAPIDYVQILLFRDFSQLANFKELDAMTPPPAPPGSVVTPPPATQPRTPPALTAPAGSPPAAPAPALSNPLQAAARPTTPSTPVPGATASAPAARPVASPPKPPAVEPTSRPASSSTAPATPPAAVPPPRPRTEAGPGAGQ